ncbi:hypothetical protein FSP39_006921 [Pinctada imbricata]|uniref:Beta-lactamase-related domain-containing protein n=1 Tax=Pinctada imbricata TaxID=66713 RepID=A0AA89C2R8_PINIB|nr:hypothetical protein FSP39_006921 [Pinctada imbricata]
MVHHVFCLSCLSFLRYNDNFIFYFLFPLDKLKANEETVSTMECFDRVLMDFMADQRIPGASFIISYHGKILYAQGYGVAGPCRLSTSSSKYRIASITKPITAMAMIKAVEEGRIGLQQKVFYPHGILKHLKPSGVSVKQMWKITVRDLLQHSGGWDREKDMDVVFLPLNEIHKDDLVKNAVPYNECLAKFMMDKKLQFNPGKHHAYSNYGYLLLGLILEEVYGRNYEELIHALLDSIDVGRVCSGQETRQTEDYMEVEYYEEDSSTIHDHVTLPGSTVCQPQYGGLRMKDAAAYGGLVASVYQLIEIFHHLDLDINVKNRLLTETSIQKMLTRPSYEDSEDWYGLGLDIQDSGQSWGHTGSMDGSSGTFHRDKSGLTWVLLFNACSKDTDLDGLIKYGLSKVSSLPLYCWKSEIIEPMATEIVIVRQDEEQVLQVMLPFECNGRNLFKYHRMGYAVAFVDIFAFKNELFLNLLWTKLETKFDTMFRHWKIDQNEFDCIENIALRNVTEILLNKWKILDLSCTFIHDFVIVVIIFVRNEDKDITQSITFTKVSYYDGKEKTEKKTVTDILKQSVCVHKDVMYIVTVHEDLICKKKVHLSASYLNLTPDEFLSELRKKGKIKKGLMYCEFYNIDDKVLVNASWSKREKLNCYQRYGASLYGFSYEVLQSFQRNIPLRMISTYNVEGILNFAGIWSASKL